MYSLFLPTNSINSLLCYFFVLIQLNHNLNALCIRYGYWFFFISYNRCFVYSYEFLSLGKVKSDYGLCEIISDFGVVALKLSSIFLSMPMLRSFVHFYLLSSEYSFALTEAILHWFFIIIQMCEVYTRLPHLTFVYIFFLYISFAHRLLLSNWCVCVMIFFSFMIFNSRAHTICTFFITSHRNITLIIINFDSRSMFPFITNASSLYRCCGFCSCFLSFFHFSSCNTLRCTYMQQQLQRRPRINMFLN